MSQSPWRRRPSFGHADQPRHLGRDKPKGRAAAGQIPLQVAAHHRIDRTCQHITGSAWDNEGGVFVMLSEWVASCRLCIPRLEEVADLTDDGHCDCCDRVPGDNQFKPFQVTQATS